MSIRRTPSSDRVRRRIRASCARPQCIWSHAVRALAPVVRGKGWTDRIEEAECQLEHAAIELGRGAPSTTDK
eukprot:9228953-Pyramimonas_sp.AAC.1